MAKPFAKKTKFRDFLSASEWNRLTALVTSLVKSSGVNVIVDTTGVHTRKMPLISGSNVRIAAVDDEAAGGGYYTCFLQKVSNAKWNTDTIGQLANDGAVITVLNLSEVPLSGDTDSHILNSGTLMEVWEETDDAGTIRWVGHAIGRYRDCSE